MPLQDILVVEDRADWQTIVRTDLQHAGYTAHAAQSYAEAVAALHTRHFALAIIDPVLDITNRFNRDGLSVLQQICTSYPTMPIMIITGSLTRDVQQSLQHLCPDAPVLLKECWDSRTFTDLVHQLLGTEHPAPVPDAPDALPTTPESSDQPPTPPPPTAGSPRVLLVENRPDWQTIVIRVLEQAGCSWRMAANAHTALHELEQERFHLVVLDLKLQANDLPLPSSEGWLLLDHVIEAHPTTRVLILSGKACPGDVAELLTRYPIIGFIEKQRFTPQALLDAVAEATRAPQVHIQTLGTFRVWRNGQEIGCWERPQAETLVKMLLARRAQGSRVMAVDELITRFWPDENEHNGRKKLLPLISNARRTLEPDIEPRDSHFILRQAGGYFFDLGTHVTWDVLQFRSHVHRGLHAAANQQWQTAVEELEQAQAHYSGDFLAEDRYSDWAIEVRRDLTGTYCSALTVLAESYTALGNTPAAIATCEAVLHKDPLRESIYRRLMGLYVAHGDKGQALKVYRDCKLLFEDLFGEQPSPLTHQLAQAIASDNPIALERERWLHHEGRLAE